MSNRTAEEGPTREDPQRASFLARAPVVELAWLVSAAAVAAGIGVLLPWADTVRGTGPATSTHGTGTEWSGSVVLALAVLAALVGAAVALRVVRPRWVGLAALLGLAALGILNWQLVAFGDRFHELEDRTRGRSTGHIAGGLWLSIVAEVLVIALSAVVVLRSSRSARRQEP